MRIPIEYPLQVPVPYVVLPSTIPQSVTVELTSDQLLNLHAVPINLVANPGEGLAVVPIRAQAVFFAGETPYDTSGGGGASLYNSGDGVETTHLYNVSPFLLALLESEDKELSFVTDLIGGPGIQEAAANFDNKGLWLFNGGSGEYTDGDGTLRLIVEYYIIDLN